MHSRTVGPLYTHFCHSHLPKLFSSPGRAVSKTGHGSACVATTTTLRPRDLARIWKICAGSRSLPVNDGSIPGRRETKLPNWTMSAFGHQTRCNTGTSFAVRYRRSLVASHGVPCVHLQEGYTAFGANLKRRDEGQDGRVLLGKRSAAGDGFHCSRVRAVMLQTPPAPRSALA